MIVTIRIVEQTESQARVHYDEWRDKSELETIDTVRETENREEATVEAPLQPFSLYRELTIKILKALTCGRKNSPAVRICLSFDIIQFNGGFKTVGVPSKINGGIQYYRISHYRDLILSLGETGTFED